MNVLVSIDDNYTEQLITMLYSLFLNNHEKINVYLIYSSLKETNQRKIEEIVNRHKNKITFIEVERNYFRNAPKRAHTTYETYYRLLAFDLLDTSVEKILYLDPDIVVTGDITRMYHSNISKFAFAGVRDWDQNKKTSAHKKRLSIPNECTYINAGVLLINLKMLRSLITVEDIFRYIEDKGGALRYQDQDIINGMFYDKIHVLPTTYNYGTTYKNRKDAIEYLLKSIIRVNKRYPKIIHYMGGAWKPWIEDRKYGCKYLNCYAKYSNNGLCESLHKKVKRNQKLWLLGYLNEDFYYGG